jgi:hypothetical protein
MTAKSPSASNPHGSPASKTHTTSKAKKASHQHTKENLDIPMDADNKQRDEEVRVFEKMFGEKSAAQEVQVIEAEIVQDIEDPLVKPTAPDNNATENILLTDAPVLVQYIEAEIVQDEEDPLVADAFEFLKNSFRSHFHEAMLEAGRYLVEKFYENNYEWARQGKKPKKKGSLNKLIERLQANSGDAPSKTWIYDAVKLAADEHFYELEGGTIFRAYGKLGHSQKLRIAYVKQPEIKEKLIEEIADKQEPLTDRVLRERIAKEKEKIPKKKRSLSILQAIKSHKKLMADEAKEVRSVKKIKNLSDKELKRLSEDCEEAVRKIKSEIDKRKNEIAEFNKQLDDFNNISKRIRDAKNMRDAQIETAYSESDVKLPENPLTEK